MLMYFTSIITALLYFSLSFLTFQKRNKNRAIRWFAVTLFLAAFWVITLIFETLNVETHVFGRTVSNILAKIDFSLAAIIAYTITIFSLHFPTENKRIHRLHEILLCIPILSLVIATWCDVFFSNFITFSAPDQYFTAYWVYFGVLVMYFIVITLSQFISKLIKAEGIHKLRLQYIVFSYGLSIIILLALSVLNSQYIIPDKLDLWLSNASLIFISGTSYAVLKYRLFGVRFLLNKTLLWALTSLILLGFYVFMFFLANTLNVFEDFRVLYRDIIKIAFIVITLPLLYMHVRRSIQELFSPSEKLRKEKVVNRVRQYYEENSYLPVLKEINDLIRKECGINIQKAVALEVSGDYYEQFPEKNETQPVLTRLHPLIHIFKEHESILLRSEINFILGKLSTNQKYFIESEKLFKDENAEVALMFGTQDVCPVIVFLPIKPNRKAYTEEEINFLKDLSFRYSQVIENIFLYHQAMKRIVLVR